MGTCLFAIIGKVNIGSLIVRQLLGIHIRYISYMIRDRSCGGLAISWTKMRGYPNTQAKIKKLS